MGTKKENQMTGSKFVILGGGMVAGYAAKQLVELGLKAGELTIISADTSVPYERPPLSKGFLAGKDNEEAIRINPDTFYREQGIEIRLKTEVASVDPKRKELELRSGEKVGFEKLIIATGARPRTLTIPGASLRNIHYLRSLHDSESIRNSAQGIARAVVVGGGFIGMEVAAVLAQKGIEVTMILNEDRIWKRFFSPEMSTFFESYYSERGVRFLKDGTIKELVGDGDLNSVKLADGKSIPCQMLVAGIGVIPVTDVLTNSGIEVGDGVVVNEYLQATQPNIYAAGDVANYQDLIFGKRRRVEHWDNAVSQGQYLARTLMGERVPFRHVPYFFSDLFDLSYEYWGDGSGADEVVHRGDMSGKSFSVWWLMQKRVVAAFTMNRPDEEREAAAKWIEAGRHASSAKLKDANRPIESAIE